MTPEQAREILAKKDNPGAVFYVFEGDIRDFDLKVQIAEAKGVLEGYEQGVKELWAEFQKADGKADMKRWFQEQLTAKDLEIDKLRGALEKKPSTKGKRRGRNNEVVVGNY